MLAPSVTRFNMSFSPIGSAPAWGSSVSTLVGAGTPPTSQGEGLLVVADLDSFIAVAECALYNVPVVKPYSGELEYVGGGGDGGGGGDPRPSVGFLYPRRQG